MLQATNLTLRRGNQRIIEQLNISLTSQEVMGVLGTNGAGKSTLFYGLSGELAGESGTVKLGDRLLSDWPPKERARRLAILPQLTQLNFSFTVTEVIGFGRLPHLTTTLENQRIIDEMLALVDITHLAHRNFLHLSGGERQRVHLARVLAQLWPITNQSVLLLDEPTSMLDPLHQHTLLRIVKRCAEQGAAVIVILHDLNLASRYCDRLMLLQQGRLFVEGTPAEVLTSDYIEQVFGLNTLIQPHPEHGYPVVIAR